MSEKKNNGAVLGIVLVLAAGILWGHTGFFVRYLEAMNVTSIEISVMRLSLTFFMMFIGVLIVDRSAFLIKGRYIWYFIGSGACGMVGSSLFYFYAISMTSLAVAAVLMYTAPTIVVIISIFVFRQKLTPKRAICCVVAFIGAALASGILAGVQNVSVAGILYGCAAGLSYALYSVFSALAIGDGAKPISVTLYSFFFAMLGILVSCNVPVLISKISQSPSIILIAGAQALLTCLAPYVLYTIGLKYTDAAKASIMSTVELVVASLIGLVSFGETISVAALSGMVLVIVSIVFLNIRFPSEKTYSKKMKKTLDK